MALEYTRPTCGQSLSEITAAALIKRAAAHNLDHHGGPEQITPELELAVRQAAAAA